MKEQVRIKNKELHKKHMEILSKIDDRFFIDFDSIKYESYYFVHNFQYDYISRFKIKHPVFKDWLFKIWIIQDGNIYIIGEHKSMINKFKPSYTFISELDIDTFVKKLNQIIFVDNILDRNFKDPELRKIKNYLVEAYCQKKLLKVEQKFAKSMKIQIRLQLKNIILKYRKYFDFEIKNHSLIILKINYKSRVSEKVLKEKLILLMQKLYNYRFFIENRINDLFFNKTEVKNNLDKICREELTIDGWNYSDCYTIRKVAGPAIVLDKRLKKLTKEI